MPAPSSLNISSAIARNALNSSKRRFSLELFENQYTKNKRSSYRNS